jgi:hypothetical protein
MMFFLTELRPPTEITSTALVISVTETQSSETCAHTFLAITKPVAACWTMATFPLGRFKTIKSFSFKSSGSRPSLNSTVIDPGSVGFGLDLVLLDEAPSIGVQEDCLEGEWLIANCFSTLGLFFWIGRVSGIVHGFGSLKAWICRNWRTWTSQQQCNIQAVSIDSYWIRANWCWNMNVTVWKCLILRHNK